MFWRRSVKILLVAGLFLFGSCSSHKGHSAIRPLIRGKPLNKIGGIYRGISSYYVDQRGNVYIANPQKLTVDKYSETGRFLGSFGRRGEGPGEFKFIYPFAANSRGNLYVSDFLRKRIMVFSPEGKFIREVETPEPFIEMKFTPADLLLLYTRTPDNVQKIYLMVEKDGKLRFKLLREDSRRKLSSSQMHYIRPAFRVAFAGDKNGNVYIADSCHYRIYIFSKDGILIGEKNIPWKREKIKERDLSIQVRNKDSDSLAGKLEGLIKIMKDKMKSLEGNLEFFPAIINMDYFSGKLYVWTSRINSKGDYIIDVYSPNLKLLYKRTGWTCVSYGSYAPTFIRNASVFIPESDATILTGRLSCVAKMMLSDGILRFRLNE